MEGMWLHNADVVPNHRFNAVTQYGIVRKSLSG